MSKTPSRKLFQLIHALSSSEKRYFKIFANKSTSENDNKYLLLFNAIEEQTDYDEAQLKELLYPGEQIESRKFSEMKAYLYDLILKSLHSYDEKNFVEFQLNNHLKSIQVLFKRSLYEDCKMILQKAKKLAFKYEYFLHVMRLLSWEKKLAYTESNVDYLNKNLERINQEERDCLMKIQNESSYWEMFFEFLIAGKRDAVLRSNERITRYKKLIEQPLLSQEDSALSHRSRILFYRIHSVGAHATGEWDEFYKYNKTLFDIMGQRKNVLKEDPSEYISVVSNLILSCGLLRKYNEVGDFLEVLKGIPTVSLDDEFKIFTQYYLNKLAFCTELGDFKEGVKAIEACERDKKKFKSIIFLSNYYFQYSYIYFGVGDYDNALHWINELLNLPKSIAREDLQSVARLLNLMVHFEMGNEQLLDHLLRSIYRFLKKRERLFQVERSMLNFFRESRKCVTRKQFSELCQTQKEEMKRLARNPAEMSFFRYFNFLAWLDSKIENKDFGQAIKDRLSNSAA